jgi:hypothetical protein
MNSNAQCIVNLLPPEPDLTAMGEILQIFHSSTLNPRSSSDKFRRDGDRDLAHRFHRRSRSTRR